MTTSSKVRFMSSIIAWRLPPAVVSMSVTGRGVLSSSVRPSDWARRRAGSMVRTTTLRPDSAARRPSAAAVVVLPTPPEPQQTTICVRGVVDEGVDVERRGLGRDRARAHASSPFGRGVHGRRAARAGRRARAPSRSRRRSAGRAAGRSAGPWPRAARAARARGRCAAAWSRASSSRPSTSSGVARDAGLGELGADRRLVQATRARLVERDVVEERLAHHVDDDGAGVQALGAQLVDRLEGLLHRHLLEEGDEVDDRLVRLEQPGDRAGLRGDRADPGEVGHLGVDREEPADAAGRRRVEDDAVVGGGGVALVPAVAAAPVGLVDLADEQDVAHAGGDGRREVDGAELLEQLAGAAELVEELEVLEQGGLGLDGQADDLAAAGEAHDPGLLGAERRHVEGLADALPALDLGEQHVAGARREGQRDARRRRSSCRCRPCP